MGSLERRKHKLQALVDAPAPSGPRQSSEQETAFLKHALLADKREPDKCGKCKERLRTVPLAVEGCHHVVLCTECAANLREQMGQPHLASCLRASVCPICRGEEADRGTAAAAPALDSTSAWDAASCLSGLTRYPGWRRAHPPIPPR